MQAKVERKVERVLAMKGFLLAIGLWLGAISMPAAAQPAGAPSTQSVQSIGLALQEAAGTAEAKFVLYAYFDDSNSIVTIRHVLAGSTEIKPLFLAQGSIDLPRLYRELGSPDGIMEMIYVLDHGRLDMILRYPDQIPPGTTSRQRMEAAVREHLGPS